MDTSQIISFYLLTQSEIDKLWEFYIVSHLAIIGWLISVDGGQIERARKVLGISYAVLFGGLFFFFYEAYNDMILIQIDLKNSIELTGNDILATGYIHQLISTDISGRFARVGVFFSVAFLCTIYLLFHPTLFKRSSKNPCQPNDNTPS